MKTPSNDDRVIVVVPDQKKSHPILWFGVGAVGVIAGLLFFRGRQGWAGGRGTGPRDQGSATPVPVTTIQHDPERLTFVMMSPSSFRGPEGKIYSLNELVLRVAAGGRMDVTLKIPGSIRQGDVQAAKATIKGAGIDVFEASTPVLASGWHERGIY